MNFTETFEQFSSRIGPTDLALYAGAGIVVWVLFKDRLGPVQGLVSGVVDFVKNLLSKKNNLSPVVVPAVEPVRVNKDDTFFKLVVSWKQTRDLAVQSGCSEAVKVADQMFPFLSVTACGKNDTGEVK